MSKTSPAALAVLLNKTLPCRSYTPCIFLEISGMNLCSAAVSWIVLFFAVRSCNLLDRSGFPCVALHCLGSLCGFLDELASLDELIAPSGFKENGGGKKELARLRILLVSKTDNPYVSTRTPSNDKRRAEWWKLILLTRPRDAYPHFLASRVEIEALLRAGHTMHRVWEAYRQASPPFPATYETFRTYCVKLGLSKLRNGPISAPPEAAHVAVPPPSSSPPSANARPSPKVWPRIPGKPREFIPRTEDD